MSATRARLTPRQRATLARAIEAQRRENARLAAERRRAFDAHVAEHQAVIAERLLPSISEFSTIDRLDHAMQIARTILTAP